jgi:8-oxo-dGTP pyrophosphatase MutT (NUDIX family)/predicted kinase
VLSHHIRDLRAKVGHDLLLLPSTAVLPRDEAGRILLVRLVDTGNWATIGGAVEPDEGPRDCAVREAEEEAGVKVELGRILGVFGGPDYRVTYPNGDRSAYVVTVFDATVIEGTPRPDGDETCEVGWFAPEELPLGEMGGLTKALLRDVGLTRAEGIKTRQPILVVVTGLQGTGKSTVAAIVADALSAPLIAHDWAMSGLRAFPEVQAALDTMDPPGHGPLGWSILRALARSQLRRRSSVVLDGVARASEVDALRALSADEAAGSLVIMTECSDLELHRSRVEGRERGIPGWYELDWHHVEQSRERWNPDIGVDVTVDSAKSLATVRGILLDRLAALG